jgi:PncC family amidohydrolase
LHIDQKTIEKYGAVSKETAKLMAENVKSIFGADISISFTGVAGPEKQEGKEVGTVFIGICLLNKTYVFEEHFKGNRNEIRDETVKFGINKIINLLGG